MRDLTAPVLDGSGLDQQRIIEMGVGIDGDASHFDMTAYALRNTTAANGVSQLHGRVANETWSPLIDHAIGGITNGVHAPTWVGRSMRGIAKQLGGTKSRSTMAIRRTRSTG